MEPIVPDEVLGLVRFARDRFTDCLPVESPQELHFVLSIRIASERGKFSLPRGFPGRRELRSFNCFARHRDFIISCQEADELEAIRVRTFETAPQLSAACFSIFEQRFKITLDERVLAGGEFARPGSELVA